jgi:oligoribonuclease
MKLLFLDVETTGLSPKYHDILELATTVVDGTTLEEGASFHKVVYQPVNRLAPMDAWCRKTHTESGLLDEVVESTFNIKQLDEEMYFFVSHNFGTDKVELAGNSVHFDMSFIKEHMPRTAALLSHRIVDVSGMARALRRLGVPIVKAGSGVVAHRAQPDVRQSIDQLHLIRAAALKGQP